MRIDKKILKNYKLLILIAFALVFGSSGTVSQVLNLKENSVVRLSSNAVVSVNGGLSIATGATLSHSPSAVSNLWVSGRFENFGNYTQNILGILRFFGTLQDSIAGSDFSMDNLWIMKSGSSMVSLSPSTDLTISRALRLISNNRFNLNRSNLIIDSTANYYPDSTSTYTNDPLLDNFSTAKHITTSGEKQLSGALIRRLPVISSLSSDLSVRFPIGTPLDTLSPTVRNYSPSRYVFNAGEATTNSGAFLSLRCIAAEHPKVEVNGVSLRKYWKTDFANINVTPGGYNVRFNYDNSEVQGTEEYYMLCLLYRPFDGPNGTFYINSGAGYGVEPVNNRFYVDEVNKKDTLGGTRVLLDGEWSAGQQEAISTFYYSINNGDWTDPTTWSKQGYTGDTSATYPTTFNDKVFIGNGKTVTISATTPVINSIRVQNSGRLLFSAYNSAAQGDSLFVEAGGTIAISSDDGVSLSGPTGNVQTTHRVYSQSSKFEFIGDRKQVTGNGIPDIIGSLILNKTNLTDTVSLSKSILIRDSLVINQGTYHLFRNGNFTSNGETGDTTNRRIIMRGGELSVQNFPTKYKNGLFTAGTVAFDGTGSFRIPSSVPPGVGEPAVTQYFNLKLSGSRGANTYVTLDPSGELRIGGNLDVSGLTFDPTPITDRFIVTGSTVVFNGTSDQTIPTGYASPTALNYRLKFHNLNIAGSGNKTLGNPNDDDPQNNFVLVRNFVNLQSGTLVANNYHLKVLNSWFTTPGASFNGGSGLVTFEADGKTTNIQSNGIQFNNVNITGTAINGVVSYTDSMTVGGNLTINPANFRAINSSGLSVRGNFTNNGTFTPLNGRVYFNGSSGDQVLDNNGKGNFYNITVNKSSGMVRLNGDSLVRVTNDLTLQQGNIGGRLSDSVANKPLVVDGTITRPGGSPGHVDGRLRLPTVEGTFTRLFPIGLGNDYAPMDMDVNGAGGAAGYLDAYIVLDTDALNMTRAVIETQVPNGPELDSTKNVRKVWVLHADTTSSPRFQLASSRTYDVEFFFPASDLRNGANPSSFEIGQRDTLTNTGRWSKPFLSERNALSTKFSGNQKLNNNTTHYFILGDPKVFTYYSIADGNWDNVSTWSTAGYLSTEPAFRAPASNDNIRIGNGKTVTLNTDHVVGTGRLVVIETGGTGLPNGHLVFDNDTRTLTGTGTFRLDSGAAITIRHSEGIVNIGSNTGAVRTTGGRDYNYNNHNSGHFIFARSGNQATGNGYPATVRTLQMNMSGGTLTFTGTSPVIRQVWDSVYFANGTANLSTVIFKIGGNFVVDNTAGFTPGSSGTTGSPYASDAGSVGENNRRDSVQYPGVIFFNGSSNQTIRGSYSDAISPLAFNRITVSKRAGELVSTFNLRANVMFLNLINRAKFNFFQFNKYLQVYNPAPSGFYWFGRGNVLGSSASYIADPLYGYIFGRLVRYVGTPATNVTRLFPIGSATKYTPAYISETAQQGGMLELQAIDGNHPNFNVSNINQNTNIQRYYEVTKPVGLLPDYIQGDNSLQIRLYITEDEPRGGINPLNYKGFRLVTGFTWSSTANITTTNTSATEIRLFPNNPTLGGNNVFSVPSQFTASNAIVLMIGEPAATIPERIFYSRNSGDWTNPNTWAYSDILFENTEDGYDLTTNTVNDYPRFNNGSYRDFAIIGDGDSVYFDLANSDLRYVLLEKSASGVGKLVMPNESFIRTDQYVQKNGGKISIGSRYGITDYTTATANPGNIRRLTDAAILNYDWNSLGVNNFAYIGASTDNVQNTGPALPTKIASLEIDYNRSAADKYVELTNDANLIITDSIVFKNGRFRNRDGNRTVTLYGDIVNYSGDVGFHNQTNPSNRTLFLSDTLNQKIRGTAGETRFPQTVRINKTKGTITGESNFRFDGTLEYYSDVLFNLNNNTTLTFGESAVIDSLDKFSSKRLFKVSGSATTAKVRKVYPVGTSSQTFTFPIGEDSLGLRAVRYGEARFTLTNQIYAANNYLELTLRSNYPHPNAPAGTPNMLSKYWSVSTSNITLGGGSTSARFRYNDPEYRGNILRYTPTLYRRADVEANDPGWSFELFNASNLQVDTTNKFIIIDNAVTLPYHDWTAADPASFVRGRIYWSRANGDWSNPNIWTNFNNAGSPHTSAVPALNSPGYFPGDTVIIGANHLVYYDATALNSIDSLGVGVALSTSPELRFLSTTSTNKSLFVKGNMTIGSTGLVSKDNASGTSVDTLYISRIFENTGNGGRGVDFHPNTSRKLRLEFIGTESSFIRGEGNYSSLGTVRVNKADSIYNLHNESETFSNRFTTSVLSIPSVDFILDAGMYYHNNASNITLSTDGDGDVFLGDLVGLVIQDGNVTYSDGLICGQNASVWLENGNLTIGNAKNENFQYESTTIIDFQGSSKLFVAGALRRRFLTSAVNFRIKDNARIEVMIKGAQTNSAERRAAFDFGEANSQFTMTGGTVVIYRPMELSVASEKDPDYYVNTTTSTVTGGTVQFGHPDSTVTGEPFNLIASTPFWNLDLANTYGEDLFISSPIVSIRNDLTIRDNSILNQNGNTINLGGDLTIDGLYKTGSVGPRRFSFFGNSSATPATKQNQLVKIKLGTNDPFYDFVVNKPNGGIVELSNDPLYTNSNVVLKNTLEFSINNTGIISTGDSRYIQVGTQIADLASVQRFGGGYVNGELRRWFNDGAQDKTFMVGTATDYTPARIEVTNGTGTAGTISVTAYGIEHPDIANCTLHQTDTHIDRYWRVLSNGSSPASLGSRNYTLTLFYKKGLQPAGDQKAGSSFGTFEHFRRTPEWNLAGDWYLTAPDTRTDSSTTTKTNTAFGDFFIAEIAGARFYSRQTGNWNDIATWSTVDYYGGVAPRLPNLETDRVYIGNGRTVTIDASNPRVRSVTVEEVTGQAGKLVILDERYLRGLSFELNDNCYLTTDDAFGFTNVNGPTPNIGAIRSTSIRAFGKGTIEYVGQQGQAMGDGPVNPKTIIVNNTGLLNNTVSFSSVNYTVEDTVYVKNGKLSFGSSFVNLLGDIVADPTTMVQEGLGTVNINGTGNQFFVMHDSTGMSVYNLIMNKTNGNLVLAGNADSNSLNIRNNILFETANTSLINSRLNSKRVVLLDDTTNITRSGSGHIDGMLLKPFGSGAGSYVYPIGFGAVYTPATLTLTAGAGSSGYVAGITNSPPNAAVSRISPTKKVNYYWALTPEGGFSLGSRTANTKFVFPSSELANLTGGAPNDALLLRKSIPVENPLWSNKNYSKLSWNVAEASVEVAAPVDYWTGLGEFYLGEKYKLTFYSRQDGVWNDFRSWSLDEARTIDAPEGEYPNPSSEELQDSVIIGKSDATHTILLNVANPSISGITLLYDGKLDLHNNGTMLGNTLNGTSTFRLLDSSTVKFGGTINPTTSVLTNFSSYVIGAESFIEFYGTQTLTPSPLGDDRYRGNVLINGIGTKVVNNPILIMGNLYLDGGATLDVQAIDALSVRKSVINGANIMNRGIIEIGE